MYVYGKSLYKPNEDDSSQQWDENIKGQFFISIFKKLPNSTFSKTK